MANTLELVPNYPKFQDKINPYFTKIMKKTNQLLD
jgi:hypothetical protein